MKTRLIIASILFSATAFAQTTVQSQGKINNTTAVQSEQPATSVKGSGELYSGTTQKSNDAQPGGNEGSTRVETMQQLEAATAGNQAANTASGKTAVASNS